MAESKLDFFPVNSKKGMQAGRLVELPTLHGSALASPFLTKLFQRTSCVLRLIFVAKRQYFGFAVNNCDLPS